MLLKYAMYKSPFIIHILMVENTFTIVIQINFGTCDRYIINYFKKNRIISISLSLLSLIMICIRNKYPIPK